MSYYLSHILLFAHFFPEAIKIFACVSLRVTAGKMSKYGDFGGPHFPVFSPNKGKYRPEKAPHLDTFHAVCATLKKFYHYYLI